MDLEWLKDIDKGSLNSGVLYTFVPSPEKPVKSMSIRVSTTCKTLDYQKAYQTTLRYISTDHKTGFKMTLGQNEKFCRPF